MRALVIGVDGAPFKYLDPWIESGELPTLGSLIAGGVRAKLRSTPSPYTNVAWPALVTGKNPGKTGVFDAARRIAGSYELAPTNVLGFDSEPVWSILGRHGLRAGVINVPMTYPPRPLDGYLVPGFDTPRQARDPSFPARFMERCSALGHPYRLLAEQAALMARQNPHQQRGDTKEFIDRWADLTSWQGQFLAWLWKTRPVDFMMTVFTASDSVNHRAPQPDHLCAVYRAIDAALADVLRAVGEDLLVCVVSDHGSIPARWYVSLHRLLADLGLLRFQSQIATSHLHRASAVFPPVMRDAIVNFWAWCPAWVRRLLSVLPLAWEQRLLSAYDNIDWERTQVYPLTSTGPLYVNRVGREPCGCVSDTEYEAVRQRTIKGLRGIVSPATGEPLFDAVHRGEEIYEGPALASAPDLIFSLRDFRHHVITGFSTDPLVREIPKERPYGAHTPDGIFILNGPGIQRGKALAHAEVTDVVPTLLAALGVPVPLDIDGRVLTDVFETIPTPSYQEPVPLGGEAATASYSLQESTEILQRLKDLGYL